MRISPIAPAMSVAPDRYVRLDKLGEGTYSTVYKAQDTVTKEIVALKCIRNVGGRDGIRSTILRQISILSSLSHPNLLQLKDVIVMPKEICLITEYLECDLRMGLRRARSAFRPELVCSYGYQMLSGVVALHTRGIMHRDLSPDHILLDRDGILKIGDFAFSRYFTLPARPYTPDIGAMWYRAPEQLFGEQRYDSAIDTWAVACIIVEMSTGRPLFTGDSHIDQMHKICAVLGTPAKNLLPLFHEMTSQYGRRVTYPKLDLQKVVETDDLQLVDLLEKMFRFDPSQRITPQDAIYHPYFEIIAQKMQARYGQVA
jgi:serine/threonine protein kinase